MDWSTPSSSLHGISQVRILKWVVIPFFRGSSRPRDWTLVSCIASRFFTVWATGKFLACKDCLCCSLLCHLFPHSLQAALDSARLGHWYGGRIAKTATVCMDWGFLGPGPVLRVWSELFPFDPHCISMGRVPLHYTHLTEYREACGSSWSLGPYSKS